MTTIKLFTSDGRALTDLSDGDYDFESLEALCADYQSDPAAVRAAQ